MAEVFATVPDFHFLAAELELVRNQTSQDSNSRASDVLQIGTDYWRGEVEIVALNNDEFRSHRGFLLGLEGEENSFIMVVPGDEAPQDSTITSDASLDVDSVDAANSTITLTGAGTGEATVGDKISYYTASGGYWLGEVVADASPTAGAITIKVTPAPVAPHASTPAPRRLQPLAEWKVKKLDPPKNAVADRRMSFTIEQKVPA